MEELVSSMITASGTFWLGAAGVYKFAQMPRGPAPEPPAPRQGELPRVVEVRVRCALPYSTDAPSVQRGREVARCPVGAAIAARRRSV
eukprot:COSAG02_NODE_16745_length_1058_cov_119.915537_2_plen_88_part_00